MASKSQNDDGLTRAVLDEVENNIQQASDLSIAFARATVHTWTQGLRSTVDALEAAQDTPRRTSKKNSTAVDSVTDLGESVRVFADRAAIGYGRALRDGAERYADAINESVRKRRPRPASSTKSGAKARAKQASPRKAAKKKTARGRA